MQRIATIDENRLERIIEIARENDAFKLKVNQHPGPGPEKGKHWFAMYFQAPANMTIVDSDRHVIHQNWELIGSTSGRLEEEDEGEERWLYVFEFMGFGQHGTFQYNGRRLAVDAGLIHRLIKQEVDKDPALAPKLNDAIGLESIKILQLPGMDDHQIIGLADAGSSNMETQDFPKPIDPKIGINAMDQLSNFNGHSAVVQVRWITSEIKERKSTAYLMFREPPKYDRPGFVAKGSDDLKALLIEADQKGFDCTLYDQRRRENVSEGPIVELIVDFTTEEAYFKVDQDGISRNKAL
jgi:hypothetical protein